MIGCCGAESRKFKDKKGQVDPVRLDELVSEKKAAGWSDERLEKLRQCSCPCHNDGWQVRC